MHDRIIGQRMAVGTADDESSDRRPSLRREHKRHRPQHHESYQGLAQSLLLPAGRTYMTTQNL
jgi:hypothetical protein